MLDKYIKVNDRPIVTGQTSSGIWYVKELIANTPKEAKKLMGEMNKICNEYNMENAKEKAKQETVAEKKKKKKREPSQEPEKKAP